MKRLALLFLFAASFALACLSNVGGTSGAQTPREPKRLFEPLNADKQTSAPASSERAQTQTPSAVVREQEVRVNFGAIDFAEARELSLPLFGGQSYTAVRSDAEGFDASGGGGFVWRGKISGPGEWTGDVTLSAKGRSLSGLIYSPEGVYEIVPQKDFGHLLVQIDQSLFPPCAGTLTHDALERGRPSERAPPPPGAAHLRLAPDPQPDGTDRRMDGRMGQS